MKKFFLVLVIVIPMSFFIFFNIGNFLDTTEKPVISDIIVCLGGGSPERIQTTLSLYKQGYSKQNKLLLIGENNTNVRYVKYKEPKLKCIEDSHPKNTKDEVVFIKKYMKKHAYKSALIVTDPSHSRRVGLLTSLLSVEGDEDMTFRIVDSGVKWWDTESYYKNERAMVAIKKESMGIPYSLFAYGFVDKIGFLDEFEEWTLQSDKCEIVYDDSM